MISASGTHNSNISVPRIKKLSLTPQRSAIAAHQGRDHDRGQPLTGLTQAHHRALLMAADRARLHRQDNRLDHPFQPAARDLE